MKNLANKNIKKTIYTCTALCSANLAFACDSNADLSNPLEISGQASYTSCSNINIPDNLITTKATGIEASNIVDLTNSGDITIDSTKNLHVIGIKNPTNNANLLNTGNISVTSDYASRNAYGFSIDDHDSIINEGSITVHAKQGIAYGMLSDDSKYIENNGTIDATSNGSTAYALRILDANDIINNADISATGRTVQTVNLTRVGSFENNANISATSDGSSAIGINAFNANSIYNNGDINVHSNTTSSQGIKTNNQDILENNGAINATSNTGLSIGINAIDTNYFTNNGEIYAYSDTKSATGLKFTSGIELENNANITALSNSQMTYGLYSLNSQLMVNNGDINSISDDHKAYGFYINGNTDIVNNGKVYVNSTNSDGFGIFYKNSTANLSSTNLIDADKAHIIATSTSTVNISNYALEFNDTQANFDNKYEGMLHYHTGSVINFDNTTLHAYIGEDYVNGTVFEIPVLTKNSITGSMDAVSDQFADAVVAANPDYDIELIDGNGTEKQKVSLKFNPTQSTSPQKGRKVVKNMIRNTTKTIKHDLKRMVIPDLNTSLARPTITNKSSKNLSLTGSGFEGMVNTLSLQNPLNEGSILTALDNAISFVMPFYSSTTDSSSNSYEADMTGLISGVNYILKNGILAGFHLGYAKSKVKYTATGYESKQEDSNNYIFGLQAAKKLNNFIFSAVSSLSFLRNEYRDNSAINTEKASYSATSLNTNIELGYIKKFGDITVIPKAGLNHYWFKSNKYHVTNLQNQDTDVGSVNDHNLSATLGTEVYTTHTVDDLTIRPNLNIQIEQLLTDNDISNTVQAGQTVQTVNSKSDNTILHFGSNIAFEKDVHTTTFGFTSSISNSVKNNTLFLEYKYKF